MKAKLISESLYKFEKKSDPLVSLGIGKKSLIIKWLDEMGVKNYTINEDYTIDVEGSVDLFNKGLDKFPDYIKFGKVSGSFGCNYNQLTSLEGCPHTVYESFSCNANQLVCLKGCPREVGGNFYCSGNKKQFSKKEVKKVCKVKGYINV